MREYQRKTNKGNTPKEKMEKAVKEVFSNKRSYRAVANEFDIAYPTLRRYCLKYKEKADNHALVDENSEFKNNFSLNRCGYFNNRSVFNAEQEKSLTDYLLKASSLYYGLCVQEVRDLAFEYALKLKINMPSNWQENKTAGKDWMTGFLRRNKEIAIRTAESTSLGRASSFNRHNVQLFFDNYGTVVERDHFTPDRIWNVDETGCTTVHKPNRVIAKTGSKQVGAIVSGERGQLVTICCAVNAIGNALPPMFVFPRVNYKDHFIRGSPHGSIGVAHPSGWMTKENFLLFMKHFVKYVRPSNENKVLLLLDNHESHVSVDVVNYAKENGIVMLSFPPHCSHKLQPLDKGVYGPFKTFYNNACSCWMKENTGKSMSIYDVPEMVGKAFSKAMCPSNILSGFRATGVFPMNVDIFNDDDFMPSSATERPDPDQEISPPELSHNASTQQENQVVMSPEIIRPLHKTMMTPRKKGGRKPGRTRILTDSPVKSPIKKKARKVLAPLDIDENIESQIIEFEEFAAEMNDSSLCLEAVIVGSFVLVKFTTARKLVVHSIGMIEEIKPNDEVTTKFLKRSSVSSWNDKPTFYWPESEEICIHNRNDIVMSLPAPEQCSGTSRCQNRFVFSIDFSKYDPK